MEVPAQSGVLLRAPPLVERAGETKNCGTTSIARPCIDGVSPRHLSLGQFSS